MTKMRSVGTIAVIAVASLLRLTNASALPAVPKSVSVSPAEKQIVLTQKVQTYSFPVLLTNNTSSAVTIGLSARDFTNLNNGGGLNFDIPSSSLLVKNHGLADSVSFTLKQIVLQPGQSLPDTVTINNIPKLAVGGHYTALVYNVAGLSTNSLNENDVQLNEAISTLVFLSTDGKGTQSIGLTGPMIGKFITSFPTSIGAVFQDNGNTQSTLRGAADIYDSKGNLISQGIINQNSNLILPGSSRLFNIPLITHKGLGLLPKFYTLKLQYMYAGQGSLNVYQTSFYYVNPIFPIVAIIIVLDLLVVLFRFKSVMSYFIRNIRGLFKPSRMIKKVRNKPNKKLIKSELLENSDPQIKKAKKITIKTDD